MNVPIKTKFKVFFKIAQLHSIADTKNQRLQMTLIYNACKLQFFRNINISRQRRFWFVCVLTSIKWLDTKEQYDF